MRKYVVVSNLPDDFLDDQISSEYGTYDEAVDALLKCVGHASDVNEEELIETTPIVEQIQKDNDVRGSNAEAPHLHALGISPLMEEYYVGSHVYSIYRQK